MTDSPTSTEQSWQVVETSSVNRFLGLILPEKPDLLRDGVIIRL